MYEMDQYTVSLLHFVDGLKDESGKVWTAQNGATISTAQSKFGGTSLYLNGTNQYLTTPNSTDFDFGSGDFTIDWWEYRTSNVAATQTVLSRYQTFIISDCGFYMSSGGSTWDITSGKMGDLIVNDWTHYAIVRKGSRFYGFQNGKLVNSWTSSASFYVSGLETIIGYCNQLPTSYFQGYIDELRVSKGIARWTSEFTPPGTIAAPANLAATAGDSQVTLSWNAVTGAASYNVKRSTTSGGPYTTIASNVTGTSYVDNTVTNGTTYYYVVTAVNGSGNESANSNEASATPQASSGNGLLRITMSDSSEREYQLSNDEIKSFIKWCDRTVSTGNTVYTFDDTIDRSKEYLLFDKIISFKVIPIKD